jgi:FkbM family methyltransferase
MNSKQPVPTKLSVLSRLKQQVPISSIIDVGVRECTSSLIKVFPEKKHYLFEPANLFFETIYENYAEVDYELFPIALSNSNSEIYLILTSLNKNGVVTHSKISNHPTLVDGSEIIACETVDVRRFCDMDISARIDRNFLLKVDVDGEDLNVIKGFGSLLNSASVIIIEATIWSALERFSYIQNNGFQLYDIVDLVYYGSALYQFDFVFVRTELTKIPGFRPGFTPFDPTVWSPLWL